MNSRICWSFIRNKNQLYIWWLVAGRESVVAKMLVTAWLLASLFFCLGFSAPQDNAGSSPSFIPPYASVGKYGFYLVPSDFWPSILSDHYVELILLASPLTTYSATGGQTTLSKSNIFYTNRPRPRPRHRYPYPYWQRTVTSGDLEPVRCLPDLQYSICTVSSN